MWNGVACLHISPTSLDALDDRPFTRDISGHRLRREERLAPPRRRRKNIDFSFCFGGRILKGELLEAYKNKIINFHPAILPMFPGVKSIDQALNANAFLLGNTAHFVDAGTDTGPVIMQSTLHSKTFSNYEDVLGLQLPMIYQIFCWLNENRISVLGNKVIVEKANYHQPTFYPQLEIN